MAYIRPLEIILAKKTTELVLLFHKNITKLVFLRPNMSQKSFKVLKKKIFMLPAIAYEAETWSFDHQKDKLVVI